MMFVKPSLPRLEYCIFLTSAVRVDSAYRELASCAWTEVLEYVSIGSHRMDLSLQ